MRTMMDDRIGLFLEIAKECAKHSDQDSNWWFLVPYSTPNNEFTIAKLTLPWLLGCEGANNNDHKTLLKSFWNDRQKGLSREDYVQRKFSLVESQVCKYRFQSRLYVGINVGVHPNETKKRMHHCTDLVKEPPFVENVLQIFRLYALRLANNDYNEFDISKQSLLHEDIIRADRSGGLEIEIDNARNSDPGLITPNAEDTNSSVGLDIEIDNATDSIPHLVVPDSEAEADAQSQLEDRLTGAENSSDSFVHLVPPDKLSPNNRYANDSPCQQYSDSGAENYDELLTGVISEQGNRKNKYLNDKENKLLSKLLSRSKSNLTSTTNFIDVVAPFRGTSATKYTEVPIRRVEKRRKTSRKEIIRLVSNICEHCGVEIDDIALGLFSAADDKKITISKGKQSMEQRIRQGVAIKKIGNLSDNAYLHLRMFLASVLGKKALNFLGAPIDKLREHRRLLFPKDNIFHGKMQFDIAKGKTTLLHYWLHKRPLDMLSAEVANISKGGRFVPTSEFSSKGRDDMVIVATDIDKDTETLSYMARVLNQEEGNSGERVMLFSQIKKGPAENHSNLLKFKRAPAHLWEKMGIPEASKEELKENPVYTFFQAMYADGVVLYSVPCKLKDSSEETLWGGFYSPCQDGPDVPLNRRKQEQWPACDKLTSDDDKYLSSYSLPMCLEPNYSIRIIHHERYNAPVAIAAVDVDGEVISWSALSNRDNISRFSGSEVGELSFKRVIGIESSDGKMTCTLAGHMGASSTEHCPKCTHVPNHDMMMITKTDDPLREDNLSAAKCWNIYQETNDKVQSHCISKEPIFCIHPMKMTCGTMHQWNGAAEKNCTFLRRDLKREEESGKLDRGAAALENVLRNDLPNLKKEKTTIKRDLRLLRSSTEQRRDEIVYFEKELAPKQGRAASRMETIATKLEEAKRLLEDEEMQVEQRGNEFDFLSHYIPAVERNLEELETYSPNAKDRTSFLTKLFDKALIEGLGLNLKGYFGGNTLIGRHAYIMLQKWPVVCNYFEKAFLERASGLYEEDVRILNHFRKVTKCMHPLSIIATILEGQWRTEDKREELEGAIAEYAKALTEIYSDAHPSLKLHLVIRHALEMEAYWGFIGRANEQGFENNHCTNKTIEKSVRSIKDEELKTQIFLENRIVQTRADSTLKEFEASRTKKPRKKKLETANRPTDATDEADWAKWIDVDSHVNRAEENVVADGVSQQSDRNTEDEITAEEDQHSSLIGDAVETPPSLQGRTKPIIRCSICSNLVVKAAYPFHLVHTHNECPRLAGFSELMTEVLGNEDWLDSADQIIESDHDDTPSTPSTTDGDVVTTIDYKKMKVKQLKDLLKSRSLKMSGTKDELIKRLTTDDAARDLGEDELPGDDSDVSNFDCDGAARDLGEDELSGDDSDVSNFDLDAMTTQELRGECRRRRLSSKGLRKELYGRLRRALMVT